MSASPIRVLIVDDSALVRQILSQQLSQYSDIDVVGTAVDPYSARDKIIRLQPDVLTLDLQMPRMDGLTFLTQLMKHHPLPVVVVSSLAPENSQAAIRALDLGAVEVVAKPGSAFSTPDVHRQLVRAIRAAAAVRLRNHARWQSHLSSAVAPAAASVSNTAPGIQGANGVPAAYRISPDLRAPSTRRRTCDVLAVGASTGGTRAIEVLLRDLPKDTPGTVIVQHMPKFFTSAFANRLNHLCAMEVREARDDDEVEPGVALIAPGGQHLLVRRSGSRYYTQIKDGPPIHHQRPSVDVLFHSVAAAAGPGAIGVLLTGMGADGAKGLLAMRRQGAYTLAEDEQTCVVFGMPREAIRLGAATDIIPLPQIAPHIARVIAGTAGQPSAPAAPALSV
jgi:two-component system chemotaxis response regulator CheB